MKNLTLRTTQINLLDCIHPLMDNPEEMKLFLAKLVNFISMNLIDEAMVDHTNPHAFKYNPNSSLNMLISIVDANVTLCVVISGARNVFSGEVEGAVT